MMLIKNDYDCESCVNKKVCKYYDECAKLSGKELSLKLNKKEEINRENLELSIKCKYYSSGATILNYPEGCRDLCGNTNNPLYPYRYSTTISDSYDSSVDTKNENKIVTSKKHI